MSLGRNRRREADRSRRGRAHPGSPRRDWAGRACGRRCSARRCRSRASRPIPTRQCPRRPTLPAARTGRAFESALGPPTSGETRAEPQALLLVGEAEHGAGDCSVPSRPLARQPRNGTAESRAASPRRSLVTWRSPCPAAPVARPAGHLPADGERCAEPGDRCFVPQAAPERHVDGDAGAVLRGQAPEVVAVHRGEPTAEGPELVQRPRTYSPEQRGAGLARAASSAARCCARNVFRASAAASAAADASWPAVSAAVRAFSPASAARWAYPRAVLNASS